jgi:hypothetical protein
VAVVAKTEPIKPWSTFPVYVHQSVRVFFSMAVCTEVGDRAYTLFWLHKWIHGQYIADIAPHQCLGASSNLVLMDTWTIDKLF